MVLMRLPLKRRECSNNKQVYPCFILFCFIFLAQKPAYHLMAVWSEQYMLGQYWRVMKSTPQQLNGANYF